jgi:RNA polymerase sigma-70 factor (ECF subfamily)
MLRVDLSLQNGAHDIATVLALGTGSVIRFGRRGSGRPAGVSGGAPAMADASRPVPDDAALAEQSRLDAEAFGTLYDRYCDQIYRYVYRRLADHESTEDVTAEIFLKALKAIDSYRPATAPFSAWLYRIAANAVVDHLRARRVTVSLELAPDAADPAAPVDEQAVNRVEVARVWEAVDKLTEAQRRAVTLRLGRDLPIADIAAQMGRSEGAIKLLLNRGLTAVREHLENADQVLEDQP